MRWLARLLLRLTPTRCECGEIIWPWEETAYDDDLGMLIHASCGTPVCAECWVPLDVHDPGECTFQERTDTHP